MKNNKFVVIDVVKKTYSRYVAKQRTDIIACDELLQQNHIEYFRVNPSGFLGLPEDNSPEAA